MIHVEVTIEVKAPQELVWNALTDWESHSNWIPFTRVTILEHGGDDDGVGTKFVGRTGIGKLSFDDEMTVARCISPSETGEDGKCWITKNSPNLTGNAYFHVIKKTETTSEVVWIENVSLPNQHQNHFISQILSRLGTLAFRYSLRKFAKQVERSVKRK